MKLSKEKLGRMVRSAEPNEAWRPGALVYVKAFKEDCYEYDFTDSGRAAVVERQAACELDRLGYVRFHGGRMHLTTKGARALEA